MPNEAANAAIDALMDCLFEILPEECTQIWARCVMVNGRPDMAVFYATGNAGRDVFELVLGPEARRRLADRFLAYRDAVLVPGKEGWQVATLLARVEPDGGVHFRIDTSYDTISPATWDKFAADWQAQNLAERNIVRVFDPREGVPALPVELDRALDESLRWLAERTNELDAVARIREHTQWAFDMERGEIRFNFADGHTSVAAFQAIGTLNTQDGTWLWAWDNPSIVESLRQHALAVRAFGEEHGHELLTTRKFPCDEDLAWRLTALAAKLNNAQGAYRAPADTALLFLTFGKVTLEGKQA